MRNQVLSTRSRKNAFISEASFRVLVEQSLVGIYLVQDNRFMYVNPRLAELFGYSQDEIVSRRLPVSELVAPEDRDRVLENIRRRVQGEVEDIHYTFCGRRKDGQTLDVEVHGARTEIDGEPAVIGTLLDITDRKRYEEERSRLLEEAEEAIRARDEVLAIVSHDLRNPLNTIRMAAALLMETTEDRRAGTRKSLQLIHRAANQMNVLIQDLLDVSRIEAGRFAVDPAPQRTTDLLKDAYTLLRRLAAEKSIHLQCEARGELPDVYVDRNRILQVFSNLVGNAIKFTPEQGTITLRAWPAGGMVRIAVRDTGPGIPAEHRPYIFDRFWQVNNNDGHGAGLGLAIAKGIVEAHGGEIWVESEEGDGSTFVFSLPTVGRARREGAG